MARRSYFFTKANTYHLMEHQRQQLRSTVAQMASGKLLAADVEQLAADLAKQCSVDVPILDETGVQASQKAVQIDVSRDFNRAIFDRTRSHHVEGTEVTISVPFASDAPMFEIQPMSFTSNLPSGEVSGGRIIFRKEGVGLSAQQVRAEFDAWLVQVKQHLEWHRQALGNFNQDLLGFARSEINQRRSKLSADQDLVAGLGFGTKR
jgi:hypothetical protein